MGERHAVERGTHRPGGVRAPPGFRRSATIDPIVRVQMGRLRSKLRGYYERQGAGDPIRIEIPIGAYVPFFASHRRESQPRAEPGATPPAVAGRPAPGRAADRQHERRSGEPVLLRWAHGGTHQPPGADSRSFESSRRTSSFQFKDAARDIREVGRLLDVSKVLEGSVRKAGNRIRVTVQLINVGDGCHVWSDRYEGELTDIFAIHETDLDGRPTRARGAGALGLISAPPPRPAPDGASRPTTTICRGASSGRSEPSTACGQHWITSNKRCRLTLRSHAPCQVSPTVT